MSKVQNIADCVKYFMCFFLSQEDSNLMDVTLLKDQRLPRYLLSLDNQLEYESQKLWIRVSEAIANDDQVCTRFV